mgnify:CR=1 FL=1
MTAAQFDALFEELQAEHALHVAALKEIHAEEVAGIKAVHAQTVADVDRLRHEEVGAYQTQWRWFFALGVVLGAAAMALVS